MHYSKLLMCYWKLGPKQTSFWLVSRADDVVAQRCTFDWLHARFAKATAAATHINLWGQSNAVIFKLNIFCFFFFLSCLSIKPISDVGPSWLGHLIRPWKKIISIQMPLTSVNPSLELWWAVHVPCITLILIMTLFKVQFIHITEPAWKWM